MKVMRGAFLVGASLGLAGTLACASLPPPRLVHRDSVTSIELRTDPQAVPGHSHPTTVTSEQMRLILSGLRVQKRGDPILSLLTGEAEAVPAFSATEIEALAPRLSQALAMAAPQEIVTFYRRYSDSNVGLAITSGGLFLQDHYLNFILANHRNRPADVMGHSQAMVYEVDPVDDPMLSLRAMSFALSFTPEEATVHPVSRQWRYVDPGKMAIVNLDRLPKIPQSPPTSRP